MKIFFIVVASLLICGSSLYGQKDLQVVYLDLEKKIVESRNDASSFMLIEGRTKRKKFTGVKTEFSLDSTMLSYYEYHDNLKNGDALIHDPENQTTTRGKFVDDIQVGSWYVSNAEGNIDKVKIYDKTGNNLASRVLSESSDEIFRSPNIPPQYSAGNAAWNSYLKKNLRYPADALRAKASGTVLVEFYVLKDGSIMDTFVLYSPHPALSAEAVRIIRGSGNWSPAIKDNQLVNGIAELKIKFQNRINSYQLEAWRIPRMPFISN